MDFFFLRLTIEVLGFLEEEIGIFAEVYKKCGLMGSWCVLVYSGKFCWRWTLRRSGRLYFAESSDGSEWTSLNARSTRLLDWYNYVKF